MTHYKLKLSFCIPTFERLGKIIQVRTKFLVKVTHIIQTDQFAVSEIYLLNFKDFAFNIKEPSNTYSMDHLSKNVLIT